MNYDQIFAEYFPIFRGQATNIPVAEAPEYELGKVLANNAIRKWDRADGVEWNELHTTAVIDGTGDLTLANGTTEYAAPTNMRKPPAFIYIGDAAHPVKVISGRQAQDYDFTSAIAWFTGSANTGFTLYYNPGTSFDGIGLNYSYIKKPTLITRNTSKPDMSDPNFIIQDMLASRFMSLRNGFGYKIAKQEATVALQNMKIENESGTAGNSAKLDDALLLGGWGR